MTNRRRQGGFIRPSTSKSVLDRARVQIEPRTPAGKGGGLAVQCEQSVVSSVVSLSGNKIPFGIIWGVSLFVIDSFNRVLSGWATTNVCNEVFKFAPAVADSNSTTAIIRKFLIARVKTASFHRPPHGVLRFVSHPVFMAKQFANFALQAAATSSVPVLEFARRRNKICAALTLTVPFSCFFDSSGVPQDRQSVKRATSQILENRRSGVRRKKYFHLFNIPRFGDAINAAN